MSKKSTALILILFVLTAAVVAAIGHLGSPHIALLEPAGLIAQKERDLLLLVTELSLIIVVPVFTLTIFVAWKYREGNARAKHSPDWDYKPAVDVLWWTVPTLIIIVISVVIWTSSRDLDPYKPITSDVPPIVIQVVALDWKWLFIYPKQGIATLNHFSFPAGTPVDFEITSDAPMNSFWIPELGSQIYAMPAMATQLHLIASSTGNYSGVSANISGAGFSGMDFVAQSVTPDDFNSWVQSVKRSSRSLTDDAYDALAEPSSDDPEIEYSSIDPDLFSKVITKDYMQASSVASGTPSMQDMSAMPGMDMPASGMSGNMNMH